LDELSPWDMENFDNYLMDNKLGNGSQPSTNRGYDEKKKKEKKGVTEEGLEVNEGFWKRMA
jgi:hypothetical protein